MTQPDAMPEDIALTLFRRYAGADLMDILQPTIRRTRAERLVTWTLHDAEWTLAWSFGDALITVPPASELRQKRTVRTTAAQLASVLRGLLDDWHAQRQQDTQRSQHRADALATHQALTLAVQQQVAAIAAWAWPAHTAITLTRLSWLRPTGDRASGWTTTPLRDPIPAWQVTPTAWVHLTIPPTAVHIHEARVCTCTADVAAADPHLVEAVHLVVHGVSAQPSITSPTGPLVAADAGLAAWLVSHPQGFLRINHGSQPVAWLRTMLEGASHEQ